MITINNLKNRVFAALALCAVLACGTAMANDSYQDTMRDAVARNDTRLLTDTGGATFIDTSVDNKYRSQGVPTPGAYRETMRDAIARNDTRLLSDSYSGATLIAPGTGNMGDPTAYEQTMRYAFENNDTRLLPETK